MGHPIRYLVDLSGGEFNNLMASSHQAPASYIHDPPDDHSLYSWDGKFDQCDTEFFVDLTGCWTLCTLTYPYSLFLSCNDPRGIKPTISEWEQALRKVSSTKTIYRIDDILLGPWQAKYDYLLIRDLDAIAQFISWLTTEDPLHWSVLQ
jgi:hypothetical protein